MTQSFLGCDRGQAFLLPPSLDEWLPADHFARFVIAAVEAMDLAGFYAGYRADGHGRPAHDPSMMVALMVYAYARGKRSSRVIERGNVEDIAFRVIAANRVPDHCTIARFRQRHETRARGRVRRGADVVRRCRLAGRRGARRGRHEGSRQRVGACDARLRAARQRRSCDRPTRSTRPRMSSSVIAR